MKSDKRSLHDWMDVFDQYKFWLNKSQLKSFIGQMINFLPMDLQRNKEKVWLKLLQIKAPGNSMENLLVWRIAESRMTVCRVSEGNSAPTQSGLVRYLTAMPCVHVYETSKNLQCPDDRKSLIIWNLFRHGANNVPRDRYTPEPTHD